MGISALHATASPSMDSMPTAPSSGRDRDAYGLRLESAGTADSDARLAEALRRLLQLHGLEQRPQSGRFQR